MGADRISIAVIVMAIVLVLGGMLRGVRPATCCLAASRWRGPSGILWIIAGVGGSTIVVFGATVWTVVTLAAVATPKARDADLTLEVTGHQWWWEILYKSNAPDQQIRTANEIHVPVGKTVESGYAPPTSFIRFGYRRSTAKRILFRARLTRLGSKRVRSASIAANARNIAAGSMRTWVWKSSPTIRIISRHGRGTRSSRPPRPKSQARADMDTFVRKCGACHTVAGTRAGGILGPDLSHLMTRRTIAAATLPNTIANLSGWIADPQHVKPGAYMPRLDISGPELAAVRRFLETLQ